MAFTRPYIMDPPEMDRKLEGNHELFPQGAISTPKLKEIIREFVRLEGHCDDAKALCEYNVGKIISGGAGPWPLIKYPDMPDIPTNQ
jgi:hypothetical protein